MSKMDRKEAIAEFKERLAITDYKEHIPEYYEAIELAIEALQEKDHRCDNCSNGENAGVRIYCLLHTSFHRLDEYCSEWEAEE